MGSGQSFRVYKDIGIKDMNVEGFEHNNGSMVMMEFSPKSSDLPDFEVEFWAEIFEDVLNRTLSIKLSTNGETNNGSFMVKLKIRTHGHVNFNIEPSPYASSREWYKWYSIMKKIRELEYRRTYILDSNDKVLITSSCPNIDKVPTILEGDVYDGLSQLEEKTGKSIRPPYITTPSLLKDIDELNKNWDLLGTKANISKVEQIEKEFSLPKSTLITVELRTKDIKIVPMIIMNHKGWIDYTNFELEFETPIEKVEWNEVVKNQLGIQLVFNARTLFPFPFFKQMINMRSEGEYYGLDIINKLIQINSEELPTIKTNIKIEFFDPNGLIQEIKVIIQDANEEYNMMEELLKEKKYVEAIPYLENLKTDNTTLAYAYALDMKYDLAITLADEIIKQDKKTVAHMTKGLALVGKENYSEAFEAYRLGVHICPYKWYPIAKENLESFIISHKIQVTDQLQNIIDLLDKERRVLGPKQNCYCGNGKKFKKCHGK